MRLSTTVIRSRCSRATAPFFFQAEDGIRDLYVTGVQTCALPISTPRPQRRYRPARRSGATRRRPAAPSRSEEHTSELQSRRDLVCRLLLEKKKKKKTSVM